MKIIVFVTVLLMGAIGSTQVSAGGAQAAGGTAKAEKTEPVTPVLSELDALKVENGFLVVKSQQDDLDKAKVALQTLLASLQKPGYTLARGPDGKLLYVAEPKPEVKPADMKEKK